MSTNRVACPRCGNEYSSRKILYSHVRYNKKRCAPIVEDLSAEECHRRVLALPVDTKKTTPQTSSTGVAVTVTEPSTALLERLTLLEKEQAGMREQIRLQQQQIETMREEIAALRKERPTTKKPPAKKDKPQQDIADHMAAEDPAYSSTIAFPLQKEPTAYIGDMQGLIEDLFFHPDRPSTHAWRPGPKKDTTVLSEGRRRWSPPDLLENHLISVVSLAVNRIVNEEVLAGRLVHGEKGVRWVDESCGEGLRELVYFANTGEWSSFRARKKYCDVDMDRLSALIRRSGRAGG